jgi:hypothetical protein
MFDAEIVGCVNMTLLNSIMFITYAKGSFRHLPRLKTETQKSQPQGVPRGWQMVAEADRPHQRDSILVRRSARRDAAVFRHAYIQPPQGHAHTRGEGVILCYAPDKAAESAT